MAPRTILQSVAPISIASRIFFIAPFVKNEDNTWKVSIILSFIGVAIQLTASLMVLHEVISAGMVSKFGDDPFITISFVHQVFIQFHRLTNCANSFLNKRRVAKVSTSIDKANIGT